MSKVDELFAARDAENAAALAEAEQQARAQATARSTIEAVQTKNAIAKANSAIRSARFHFASCPPSSHFKLNADSSSPPKMNSIATMCI